MHMDRYPPIADHGLIGDLQTAALVSTDGTVDWFCSPRFDSPSVFASLLDHDRGGHFRIAPEDPDHVVKQLYLPDTAILATRFLTKGGVGEVLDFMPIGHPERVTDRHRLVRVVRCVRGAMSFTAECAPRFDYGRQPHQLDLSEEGAVFRSPSLQLTLHGGGRGLLRRHGDDVRATITVKAGEAGGVILEAGGGAPHTVSQEELLDLAGETARFWRDWLAQSTYTGRWRESVERSAITLKLMTYAPTGALVAAPTTGLPEQVGGERNWDYRFTWVRDASFSVHALLGLGFTEEAEAFARWLGDRVAAQATDDTGPLRIMYRVDGSADLKEETLDHFEGYAGSKPVRIGNDASGQLQLDIVGEAIDSLYLADQHAFKVGQPGWVQLRAIMDWVCEHWDQPEEGIW
jgi:GH15 family glucan-1,4-alpha-glucosidase